VGGKEKTPRGLPGGRVPTSNGRICFSCCLTSPISSNCFTASNSPLSRFKPKYTRPNAPTPSGLPLCQLKGADDVGEEGGERDAEAAGDEGFDLSPGERRRGRLGEPLFHKAKRRGSAQRLGRKREGLVGKPGRGERHDTTCSNLGERLEWVRVAEVMVRAPVLDVRIEEDESRLPKEPVEPVESSEPLLLGFRSESRRKYSSATSSRAWSLSATASEPLSSKENRVRRAAGDVVWTCEAPRIMVFRGSESGRLRERLQPLQALCAKARNTHPAGKHAPGFRSSASEFPDPLFLTASLLCFFPFLP
jgi:hypothetical protein